MGCCATFPTHVRPSRPVPDRQTGTPSSSFHPYHHPCCYFTMVIPCHRFDATHSIVCGRVDHSAYSNIQHADRCRSFAPSRRERVYALVPRTLARVHAAQSRSRGAEQLPFMAIPGHTYEGSGAALEAGGREPDLGIQFVRPNRARSIRIALL